MHETLLKIKDLRVSFKISKKQTIPIINKVGMALKRGDKVALIGESGCGKSLLALSLFCLLTENAVVSGEVSYRGSTDLLALSERELNRLRGDRLVLIPQNPAGHLNPTLRIGHQIQEGLRQKQRLSRQLAVQESIELLSKVGFSSPGKISRMYPHQLSGGMAQRVLLAIGLSGIPEIVIADEPTRGLDSENQLRYLELVRRLYNHCALLIITHQIEVAATCDRLMVMYGGEIVEEGYTKQILHQPQHPYTKSLLKSHPDRGMIPIPGRPFSFSEQTEGCRFSPRCAEEGDICHGLHPVLRKAQNSKIRCHHAGC